jgi:hypothetical protein
LQCCKELFNPMGFNLYNCPLKIQKSIRTRTPKMGVHLGAWGFIPSHSFVLSRAWNVTPELPLLAHNLQALALVASPRLRLRYSNIGTWQSFYVTTLCHMWCGRLMAKDLEQFKEVQDQYLFPPCWPVWPYWL